MGPLTDKHFILPKADLIVQLKETRQRTLSLIEDLTDDQLNVPVMESVNPFLWELGHIAFFMMLLFARFLMAFQL